jgi:hypothetical protein
MGQGCGVPRAGDLVDPRVGDVVDHVARAGVKKGLVSDPSSTRTGAEMVPSTAGGRTSAPSPSAIACWSRLSRFGT